MLFCRYDRNKIISIAWSISLFTRHNAFADIVLSASSSEDDTKAVYVSKRPHYFYQLANVVDAAA
jgi:hypothetical protein